MLRSAVSESQQAAKRKAVKTEELQCKLKVLRAKNSDLERKLNFANNQARAQDKNSEKYYIKEIDRVKMENYKSRKQVEEMKQEVVELGNKLGKGAKENELLQQELARQRKSFHCLMSCAATRQCTAVPRGDLPGERSC